MPSFTDKERRILALAQNDLPDAIQPYAEIARLADAEEAEVIGLLSSLKDKGVIRRFGASIKHQQAGFSHNAMVVWRADEDEIERCGEIMAGNPLISHCYYRPSFAADWPYTLYTMIHGRNEGEVNLVIEDIRRKTGIGSFAVLESLREFKKTSMQYFGED